MEFALEFVEAKLYESWAKWMTHQHTGETNRLKQSHSNKIGKVGLLLVKTKLNELFTLFSGSFLTCAAQWEILVIWTWCCSPTIIEDALDLVTLIILKELKHAATCGET